MSREFTYLLEFFGVAGMAGLVAFIPLTKMALGATLTLLGAFFPSLKESRQAAEGTGHISLRGIVIRFKGGIRLAVVLAGIVVLIGAVSDGHNGAIAHQKQEETEQKRLDLEREKAQSEALKQSEHRHELLNKFINATTDQERQQIRQELQSLERPSEGNGGVR